VYNCTLFLVAQSDSGEVTRLLVSWSGGDQCALDRLVPVVYKELRRMAAGYLRRERGGHTLQPTALVHDAYLRLIDQKIADCHTRTQFFAIAANLMRQILVNHAKRHRSLKRGGGNKVALEEAAGAAQQQPQVDLVALNEALDKLAQLNQRQSRVVELRFFGGLTEEEIAEVLNVSPITVKRDWRIARAALHNQLGGGVLHCAG
jgi:RNA polymerase sigma factor (TIGR02999 family)